MQPTSGPTSSVKLPRAVIRMSQQIAEKYAKRGEIEPVNADPNAPAPAPAQGTATAADPQPTSQTPDPRHADPAYWEQRFRATEGVLKRARLDWVAETDRLHQQIAELQGKIASLQSQATTKTDPIDITKLFSPEDIELYGEEQCRVMASVASRVADQRVGQAVEATVKPLQADAARRVEAQAKTDLDAFKDKLTELHPTWMAEDTDPAFAAWLDQEDENEVVRRTIMNVYVAKRNAAGAAKMFKNWKASLAPRTAPPVAPSGSGASPGTEDQTRTSHQASVVAAGYPSPEEITAFYKAAKLNKVTAQERVDFEARLKLRR